MDKKITLHNIKEQAREYCEPRDWDQFHSPKDLAIGMSTEASELLELFRFKSSAEIDAFFTNSTKKEEIEDELADVLYFIARFAQKYHIDLSTALARKMIKNKKKYPISKAKGSNKKYTEL